MGSPARSTPSSPNCPSEGWEAQPWAPAAPCERGQSLVELALVLPALVFLLMGVVQIALVVHAQNVVTAAAQEGARYGAAEGRSAAEGARRAGDVLASGIAAGDEPFTTTAQEVDEVVTVRVSGQYRLLLVWLTGRSIRLEATAQMRREGFRAGP